MLTIEQVRQIGIPERLIPITRKEFPISSTILDNVNSWLKQGDLIIFQGNRAIEFLAVLAKYIVGEFNIVVKWVDYSQLQVSHYEVDEDGRKKIFYYLNLPVIVISDVSLLDKDNQFDIERFLKQRWLHKLPSFCNIKGIHYGGWKFNIPHKVMNIGE